MTDSTTHEAARLHELDDWLVDDTVGIVEWLEVIPRQAGEPDFFHAAARAADVRSFGLRHSNFRTTGGAATFPRDAAAKALGEAVERYCVALYDVDDLPLRSWSEISKPAVHPDELALYTREQHARPDFPWVPFREDTSVRWTRGEDVSLSSRGERQISPCWVPAALVHVPYFYYRDSGDAPIVQPISTGLACGGSEDAATLAALCEVVERDAFTIMWQARLSVPQIRVETLPDSAYDLVERFERTGSRVTLLNCTMDTGVPTFVSVLRSPHPSSPALVIAAAADLSAVRAVCKSLEELAHTRRYSQEIRDRMSPLSVDDEYTQIVDQRDHLCFWGDHERLPLAGFLFASKARQDFNDVADEHAALARGDVSERLNTALSRVASTGHRVVVASLTSPDVATLGLSVVRVVVPGLHPLFMGHQVRALGGKRLREVPTSMGYEPAHPEGDDQNLPHPFP